MMRPGMDTFRSVYFEFSSRDLRAESVVNRLEVRVSSAPLCPGPARPGLTVSFVRHLGIVVSRAGLDLIRTFSRLSDCSSSVELTRLSLMLTGRRP